MSIIMAYLDPASMTYVIQIIAGAFIAGGAAIAVYWRKIKRKVKGERRPERNRE